MQLGRKQHQSHHRTCSNSYLSFKFMNKITITLILFTSVFCIAVGQPKISFTFDDGITADQPGYSFEEWNNMLLDKLDDAEVKAVFFVMGNNNRTFALIVTEQE